jgi:transcription initiation factor TFIID subunit 7
MLVVEDKLRSEEEILATKSFNIDEFIWPHGVSPPLHWVRKRRFRKRVNRRVSTRMFMPKQLVSSLIA